MTRPNPVRRGKSPTAGFESPAVGGAVVLLAMTHPANLRYGKSRPVDSTAAGRGAYAIRALPDLCFGIVSASRAPLIPRFFALTSPLGSPGTSGDFFCFCYRRIRITALMRINIWIVLAVLLALLAITRLSQYQHETQRICADDPSASVCGR